MSQGWLRLHRKIQDDPLWLSEPFTRAQAWIDIVILANYQTSYFFIRGNKITVLRGQLARSEDYFALRWRWSRNKTRSFMKELEKDDKIVQQKSRIISLITVKNYDKYQDKDTTDCTTESTAEGTTKGTTYNTINKINKINNLSAPDGAYTIAFAIGEKEETHFVMQDYEQLSDGDVVYEDDPENAPRKKKPKTKYGSRLMSVLARCYLDVSGRKPTCETCSGNKFITNEIGNQSRCWRCKGTGIYYNANKLAKGFSKLLEQFKDPDRVMEVMKEAGAYFESKNISWTPEAVWRDWELIEKWKQNDALHVKVSKFGETPSFAKK